jgi:hypothetical protein
VLPYQAEIALVLRGAGVFHPERTVGLEIPAQPAGFDRAQPVVHIM